MGYSTPSTQAHRSRTMIALAVAILACLATLATITMTAEPAAAVPLPITDPEPTAVPASTPAQRTVRVIWVPCSVARAAMVSPAPANPYVSGLFQITPTPKTLQPRFSGASTRSKSVQAVASTQICPLFFIS